MNIPDHASDRAAQRWGTAVATTGLLSSAPALAQGIGTGTDPTTGVGALAAIVIGIIGIAIVVASAVNGFLAVNDGRHLGRAVVGLVGGAALAVSGAFVLSKLGWNVGAIAL